MISPNEKDARNAAIHEAGHVVVAREMGDPTAAGRIWKTDDPAPDERSWTGQTRLFSAHLAPAAMVMVGLAGELATALAEDPGLTAWEAMESFDLGVWLVLSETDRQWAGDYREKDVAACLDLLRQHWDDVQREAGYMLLYHDRAHLLPEATANL